MTAGLARGVLTERKRGGITAAGKKKWKGKGVGMSWKESLIYEGDRVAIVSGTGPESRDLGKIGTVRLVRRTEREVLVDHLNLVCMAVETDDGCRSLRLAVASMDDESFHLTITSRPTLKPPLQPSSTHRAALQFAPFLSPSLSPVSVSFMPSTTQRPARRPT